MKIKIFRKVLRQAKYELGLISVFGTQYGRVYRRAHPIGREWVYHWMFGQRLEIFANPHDRQFAIHKIARILWRHELKDYWTKKVGTR